MKITKALIISLLFSFVSIITPYMIEENAWSKIPPSYIHDGGWVSDKDFTWEGSNSGEKVSPENCHLEVWRSTGKDQFQICNNSGVPKNYVLMRHDNIERPWFQSYISDGGIHTVTAHSFILYYKK
jgi:hypothetical protein